VLNVEECWFVWLIVTGWGLQYVVCWFHKSGGEIQEGVLLMYVAGFLVALQVGATCIGSDTNGWERDDGLEVSAIGLGTGSTDIWTGVNGRVTKSSGIETGANALGTRVACIWADANGWSTRVNGKWTGANSKSTRATGKENAACKGTCVIGLRTSARGLKTGAKGLGTGVASVGTGMMGMRAGANCMSAGATCIEAGTAAALMDVHMSCRQIMVDLKMVKRIKGDETSFEELYQLE